MIALIGGGVVGCAVAGEETAPNLTHLPGIDSRGLTASLAIARRVKPMVEGVN